MTDHDDDSEEMGGVEIRPVTRKRRKQQIEEPAVIENEEPIPLFPNLDRDTRFVITTIRVWKRTPPGDGWKGDLPATSTLDAIAKRFGNGMYDLEALNQAQQVLRRNQNVKIDMSGLETPPPRMPSADTGAADRLLERQATQFENDARRAKELTDKTMTMTQTLSTEFATMVREDAKLRIERDREYYRAQSEQSMSMMQALLLQTQQMHQQAMSAAREGFQQTLQMMQVQHEHAQAMNNPVFLLSLFKEGLALGQSTGGDEDPLSVVVKSGVQGLGQLKDMMALQKSMTPPSLPGGKSATQRNPARKVGGNGGSVLTNEEMRDLIRLKRLAAAKGQDFHGMVKQAQSVLGTEDDEDDDSDDDSPDSSEAGAPGVAGGKSQD